MSIVGCCGAECGVDVTGAAAPTGASRHWTAVNGAGAITVDGTIRRSTVANTKSFKFAPVAGASYLERSIGSGANTEFVARTAIYIDTMPDVFTAILRVITTAGENAGLMLDPATNALSGQWLTAGTITSTYTVATGRWYVVDFYAKVDSNPRTIQVKVTDDTGVTTDLGTASRTLTGSTFTLWRFGLGCLSSNVITGIVYHDDLIWANAAADYPFGNGYVIAIYPGGDGTHSVGASGNFKVDNTTNITGSETNLWQNVQDTDLQTSAHYLTQNVVAASDYLEFTPISLSDPTNFPPGANVRAAMLVARLQNVSGTTANDISLKTVSGVNVSADLSAISLGTASPLYLISTRRTDLDGSTALSWPVISTWKWRYGFSGNVASIPELHGFTLEAEYVPTTAVSPQGRMPLIALL